MTNPDETMTRYLFGELSETEQAQLEARYFADAQTFEQLNQLETELIDGYARGRLSTPMRERFERAYLANPERRARLRFGEALAAKIDEIAASRAAEREEVGAASWWQRLSSFLTGGHRALAFSTALALLLLSLATVWLFVKDRSARQELARMRDAQAAQEQREREARQQLATEQTKTQELTAELERTRTEPTPQPTVVPSESPSPPAAAPVIASLVLVAGGVRGADTGAPPELVIHKDTQQVRLQLKLRENEYQNYQLVLQAVGGKEVFSRSRFKPAASRSSASFTITLPASKLPAGDYILTLRGATPGGELEDVSQSLFRVEKK
jgi:type II secretory pathway pseudopilin PulG